MKTRTGNGAYQPSEMSFGYSRESLDNRFVYVVVSPRTQGLVVGVNMNPDKCCNFDCVCCEVRRDLPSRDEYLDVPVMMAELKKTVRLALNDELRELPYFLSLLPSLRHMRHVALSGDGEPTLCPNFCEALQAIVHWRAQGEFPFYKLVLSTNATGLDLPNVQLGLRSLNAKDEIWVKMDGGSPGYLAKFNRPRMGTDRIVGNIVAAAQERPVVIQSRFAAFDGEEPPSEEIEAFIETLRGIKQQGAQISLVQVYSAMRPSLHPKCTHLPLRTLSAIARRLRLGTGLRAEVF